MDINSITGLLDIAAKIKQAYDKADNAQVRELITSFQEMSTDARVQAVGIKEENVKLREEILELKKQLESKTSLVQKEDKLYYSVDGKSGPYCSKCIEDDGKSISMHKEQTTILNNVTQIWWKCPRCEFEKRIR